MLHAVETFLLHQSRIFTKLEKALMKAKEFCLILLLQR